MKTKITVKNSKKGMASKKHKAKVNEEIDNDHTILDQKKLEVYMNLADSCWKEYDTRRSYEWKVSFGIWTALGIIIGFIIKEDIPFHYNLYVVSVVVILFLLIVYFFYVFQKGIQNSNNYDQEKRHVYIKQFIHPLIDFDLTKIEEGKRKYFDRPESSKGNVFQAWSHLTQIVITAILAIVICIVIVLKVTDKKTNLNNNCNYPVNIECINNY